MDILDHLTVIYRVAQGDVRQLRGQPAHAARLPQDRRGVHGDEGNIFTSRDKMTHYIAQGKREDMVSKRDITIDSIEAFITRVVENKPENAVHRSALSTCIALLGRDGRLHGPRSHLEGRHRHPDRLGVNFMHKHTAAALAAAVFFPSPLPRKCAPEPPNEPSRPTSKNTARYTWPASATTARLRAFTTISMPAVSRCRPADVRWRSAPST